MTYDLRTERSGVALVLQPQHRARTTMGTSHHRWCRMRAGAVPMCRTPHNPCKWVGLSATTPMRVWCANPRDQT
eukprot:1194149-Prorocentrum_minimum.AAC.2